MAHIPNSFQLPKVALGKGYSSKKQRGPNTLGNFTIAYHIWTPQVFSKKCNEFDNKYIQNRHSSVKRSWLYHGCVSIPLFQYFHSLAPRWQPSICPSTLFFCICKPPCNVSGGYFWASLNSVEGISYCLNLAWFLDTIHLKICSFYFWLTCKIPATGSCSIPEIREIRHKR